MKTLKKLILIMGTMCMMAAFVMGAEAKSVSVYLATKLVTTTKTDGETKSQSEVTKFTNTVSGSRQITSRTNGGKYVYTYNDKGVITSLYAELSFATYTVKYDKYGRMLSMHRIQNGYEWTEQYKYSTKMSGKALKSSVCYSSDKSTKTVTTYYTSGTCKGMEKTVTTYNRNSSKKYVKSEKRELSYKLDANKNIKVRTTKSTYYDEDGEKVAGSTMTEKYTYKKYTLK